MIPPYKTKNLPPTTSKIKPQYKLAMQRFQSFKARNLRQIILHHKNQVQIIKRQPLCDVFINNRGIDTKRTISGLLHDHLSRLGFNSFLGSKNMKPGDRLFDKIDPVIRECKIGVAVFSPRYCESYFCLRELALLMETKRRVVPIFCDVKPSELCVKDDGTCPPETLQRFAEALEGAKYTVGLPFDTQKGDWSKFLTTATDAVLENLMEAEEEMGFIPHNNYYKNRQYY